VSADDVSGPRARFPHPRKRFGQHFLRDRAVLERIVAALELTGQETVVEIGPGRGALTDLLVPRAGRLVAVEIDRDLAAMLRERYAARPNVTIIERDVLEVDLGALAGEPYVLAGNVPYYITTPILFHALRPPRPERAVYLVQREVADRIAAPPNGKDYGALSVNVQGFARAEVLFRVPPGAFTPPPQVESAVIRVTPRPDPVVPAEDEERFRSFVQAAFGLRRKQMRRVLRTIRGLTVDDADAALGVAGVDPEARPETLSPDAFARVIAVLANR
jgi:16S rRNA (adenine1518-N6/adenine1519-N6)-dimethyltransferase